MFDSDIEENISTIKVEMSQSKTVFEELIKINYFEDKNWCCKQRTTVLERKSKRNNIIIFGIPENGNRHTIEEAVFSLNRKLNLNFKKLNISKVIEKELKTKSHQSC